MKNKWIRLIVVAIMLAIFIPSLFACQNKNEEETPLGDIKILPPVQGEDGEIVESKPGVIKPIPIPDIDPCLPDEANPYANDENLKVFKPNLDEFTDEFGQKYIRKNIHKYGFSVLVPIDMEVPPRTGIHSFLDEKMLYIKGISVDNKGIQIAFFAKPSHLKSETYVQNDLRQNLLDSYVHETAGELFSLAEITNGTIQNYYNDKLIVQAETGSKDYNEYINPPEGNTVEAKKLLRRTEIPQNFRLKSIEGTSLVSPKILINYGIMMDKSVVIVTSYYNKFSERAERINQVVAESVAYLDPNKDYTLDFGPLTYNDKFKDASFYLPTSFRSIKNGSAYRVFGVDNTKTMHLYDDIKFYVSYQKLATNNPHVTSIYPETLHFKTALLSPLAEPFKMGIDIDSMFRGKLIYNNIKEHYKVELSDGEFYLFPNHLMTRQIKKSYGSVPDVHGFSRAVYFYETGELYTFAITGTSVAREDMLVLFSDILRKTSFENLL